LSHIVGVERNANLLGALAVAVNDVLWRNLGEAPVLAPSEVAALVTVANYPGQPIEVLRETLGLTHSGAVRVVDRLQRAGLLARVPAGRGRSVALTVTGTGRGQVQRIQARRLAVLTQVLDEVEAADHPALTALLEKLLTGVAGDRLSLRRICRLCDEQVCERGAACPVERAIRSKLPSDPEAE
jgi:MarR family transcriptional repressor of emrRAB